MKRTLDLTDEQKKYRSSLLIKVRKNKVKPINEIIHHTTYINNCIYWINEFYKGEATKEKALSSITALKEHLDKISKEIRSF